MKKPLPLFQHQQESITRFRNIPQGLDLSDAGTGKSRVQLELFAERRAAGGKAALIIGPKSLLEVAWVDDTRKFTPHLTTSVAYASNRDQAFACPADIYITNTDATSWLAKQPPKFFERFDTLIIDEISAFKHRTAKRSKALLKIVKYFRFRYGLSGTPMTNGVLDIWHQVRVIDDGIRLGTEYFKFRFATTTPIQTGPSPQMVKWVDKPGADTAIAASIADISVRYKLEDCHSLPINYVYPIDYVLTADQRAAYEQMTKHAILQTQNGNTVSAVNAAVLITKLLQIASGTVYDESNSVIDIEGSRYQLVSDLVAARNHSMVFFNWRHQADCLEKLFIANKITYCRIDGTTEGHQRAEIIRDFQKGYYRACLAQPQSAAHGITMTKATTAIWPSPTYNLELFLQGNRRIYRAGQTQRTETILITARNTIEAKVYARLQQKDVSQIDFLHLLKTLAV